MSETVQLKECTCEVNFGYNAGVEEYANSSSDISKLGDNKLETFYARHKNS